MGCCSSSNNRDSSSNLSQCIKQSIKKGKLKEFSFFLSTTLQFSKGRLDINTIQIRFGASDQEINILGYALMLGRVDIFKYIHEELLADPSIMEKRFKALGHTGLSVICEKCYLELFDYYAPIYLKIKDSGPKLYSSLKLRETILLSDQQDNFIDDLYECQVHTYTPVHIACFLGYIPIVRSAIALGQGMEKVPEDLDVNHKDETTLENCALLACKAGNYSMIKYLHTNTNADFFVVNKNMENALQVLIVGTKGKNDGELVQCLAYLIEKVGVDVAYNYQEAIIILENPKAKKYLVGQLEKRGININPDELEQLEIVAKKKRGKSKKFDTGEMFNFAKLFPDLQIGSVSSISCMERSHFTSALNSFE